MKKVLIAAIVAAGLVHFSPRFEGRAHADYECAEFYRDNLFLGLAYHRIACLTDWYTIQSDMEWDGYTTNNYCTKGHSSDYLDSAEWFDAGCWSGYSMATIENWFNAKGAETNTCYDTPNYQARSNTCSYDILADCNSDCWIENFSLRAVGWIVDHASGCWGSPPVGSVNGVSCDM